MKGTRRLISFQYLTSRYHYFNPLHVRLFTETTIMKTIYMFGRPYTVDVTFINLKHKINPDEIKYTSRKTLKRHSRDSTVDSNCKSLNSGAIFLGILLAGHSCFHHAWMSHVLLFPAAAQGFSPTG
jgi:hypothetical protein